MFDEAWTKFNKSLKLEDRKAAWSQIQDRMASQAYLFKLGDNGFKLAMAKNLGGFKPYAGAVRLCKRRQRLPYFESRKLLRCVHIHERRSRHMRYCQSLYGMRHERERALQRRFSRSVQSN